MALDKKDLVSIKKIVDSSAVNIKEEVKVDLNREIGGVSVDLNKGIGSLRLDMNQRFETMDKKMDDNQKVILQKIDEIRKMESEDIQTVCQDVSAIKKKLQFKTS